jgi:hypothetical protein
MNIWLIWLAIAGLIVITFLLTKVKNQELRDNLYVGIIFLCTLLAAFAPKAVGASENYIPKQAFQYFPIIQSEGKKYFPNIADPAYIAALIEHESCIHLRHSRCWNPASKFKQERELGVGLGMITKAYKKDGSLRFDALEEMRGRYRNELKELQWSNIEVRADLQIRSLVLMSRDNFARLSVVKNPLYRLHFTDAAYNGGPTGVAKERTYCGLKKGCNPQEWFGHVELTCLKSDKALYGKRSACQINRDHVRLVFNALHKYQPYFEKSF